MSYMQAIILGIMQGISELFPISSLGHSVILPTVLHWKHFDQHHAFFLIFLVATHTATALVLLLFFWKDWKMIVGGLARSIAARRIAPEDSAARLGWLLLVGTVPAGLLGLVLEKRLQSLFALPLFAAIFLICNGVLLYLAERMRIKAPALDAHETEEQADRRIAAMGWKKAFGVGIAQAVALIPGFSRSGASMAGSLYVGLSNVDAARFSFLLATPIIVAASIKKLPELFHAANRPFLGPALVGAACSALFAYLSVRFLLYFFRTNRLTPFAIYCASVGVLATAYFLLGFGK